jgi:uncharacterized protein (TIGR02246 family)
MRRTFAFSVMLIFCVAGYAMAAESVESAKDLLQLHKIEADWHTAQTNKDLNLMLSLFTADAKLTAGGKTYAGKAQIEKFWQANAAFKPQNQFVAYTPPARFKSDVAGSTGHVYFECIQLDTATNQIVPHSHVGLAADVVRVDGHWLIKDAKGTPLPHL